MKGSTLTIPWLLRATGISPDTGEIDVRLQVNDTGELFVACDKAGKDFAPAGLDGDCLEVFFNQSFTLDTAVAEQVRDIAQAWQVYRSLQGSMFDPHRRTAVLVHQHESERFSESTGWSASYLVLTETSLAV